MTIKKGLWVGSAIALALAALIPFVFPFVPPNSASATVVPNLVVINAASCVPSTINAGGSFANSSSEVAFAGSSSGWIAFNCPIPTMEDFYNRMDLMYLDSTGTNGANGNVVAHLYQVSDSTGSSSNIASISSDSFAPTGVTKQTISFSHAFDHENNQYHIVIELYRASSSYTVRAFGVRLYETVD